MRAKAVFPCIAKELRLVQLSGDGLQSEGFTAG